MKNNIIKFVSRNEFEQRKFPLYGLAINDHLDEILMQLYRDGEFLEPNLILKAEKLIRELELSTNEAKGVQG
jgi:hypothetical protein